MPSGPLTARLHHRGRGQLEPAVPGVPRRELRGQPELCRVRGGHVLARRGGQLQPVRWRDLLALQRERVWGVCCRLGVGRWGQRLHALHRRGILTWGRERVQPMLCGRLLRRRCGCVRALPGGRVLAGQRECVRDLLRWRVLARQRQRVPAVLARRVLPGQRQRLRGLPARRGDDGGGPVGVLLVPTGLVRRDGGEPVPAVRGGRVLPGRHTGLCVVRGGRGGDGHRLVDVHGLQPRGLRRECGERVPAVPARLVLRRGCGHVLGLPGGHRRDRRWAERVLGVRCGRLLGRWGEPVRAVLGGRVLAGQREPVRGVRGRILLAGWRERVRGVRGRLSLERGREPVRALPGGLRLAPQRIGVRGVPARELRRAWVEHGASNRFIRVYMRVSLGSLRCISQIPGIRSSIDICSGYIWTYEWSNFVILMLVFLLVLCKDFLQLRHIQIHLVCAIDIEDCTTWSRIECSNCFLVL